MDNLSRDNMALSDIADDNALLRVIMINRLWDKLLQVRWFTEEAGGLAWRFKDCYSLLNAHQLLRVYEMASFDENRWIIPIRYAGQGMIDVTILFSSGKRMDGGMDSEGHIHT